MILALRPYCLYQRIDRFEPSHISKYGDHYLCTMLVRLIGIITPQSCISPQTLMPQTKIYQTLMLPD